MKEAIFIDTRKFVGDNDGLEVEIAFVSPDDERLIITIENTEYIIYEKERAKSLLNRMLELWYSDEGEEE